jgi:hypothetical protein
LGASADLRRINLGQDKNTSLVKDGALFGQREAPRAAIDQARAQPFLHDREVACRHRAQEQPKVADLIDNGVHPSRKWKYVMPNC